MPHQVFNGLTRQLLGLAILASLNFGAAMSEDAQCRDFSERILAVVAEPDGPSGGDSLAASCHKWQANQARQRGGVGSLFRWSTNPSAADLPQPDEPLVADRPDFTEASNVVGLGVLQIEQGYTYSYDNDGTKQTIGHTYPETLFRYGIFANWLEFRFATTYGTERVRTGGVTTEHSNGGDDIYLGFKIGLTPQDGWRPEMGIIPQLTVPAGARSRTADAVLPGLNWLYSWELNDFIATAGSTQVNKVIDEGTGDSYSEVAQSWAIGLSLTDRLGGYTEYYGMYPSGADIERTEHYFNGGFAYLVNNDIQLDILAGKGLNSAADDYFIGSGVTIRFR